MLQSNVLCVLRMIRAATLRNAGASIISIGWVGWARCLWGGSTLLRRQSGAIANQPRTPLGIVQPLRAESVDKK